MGSRVATTPQAADKGDQALTAYLDGEVDEDAAPHRPPSGGTPRMRRGVDQFWTVIELSGHLTAANVARVDPADP
jgi:hypothetical protein